MSLSNHEVVQRVDRALRLLGLACATTPEDKPRHLARFANSVNDIMAQRDTAERPPFYRVHVSVTTPDGQELHATQMLDRAVLPEYAEGALDYLWRDAKRELRKTGYIQ